jgi:hypothetical protein
MKFYTIIVGLEITHFAHRFDFRIPINAILYLHQASNILMIKSPLIFFHALQIRLSEVGGYTEESHSRPNIWLYVRSDKHHLFFLCPTFVTIMIRNNYAENF